MANGTVVEWQDKKCVCFPKIYCKSNDHASCTTTTTTTMAKPTQIPLSTQNNTKATRPEQSVPNNITAASAAAAAAASTIYSHDVTKNCCHCHERKTICKESVFDNELCCGIPKTSIEWEQMKLCAPECSLNKFKCDAKNGGNAHNHNNDDSNNDDQSNENDDENDNDDTDFRNEIIRINNIYNNCNANANTETITATDSFNGHAFSNSTVSLRTYKNDINLWLYWTRGNSVVKEKKEFSVSERASEWERKKEQNIFRILILRNFINIFLKLMLFMVSN